VTGPATPPPHGSVPIETPKGYRPPAGEDAEFTMYAAQKRAILERERAPMRPVIRALARWASAWDDTHGKSFLAGDAEGERLRVERDDAETALRQAWRELVDE
jgi:hypothetical protein